MKTNISIDHGIVTISADYIDWQRRARSNTCVECPMFKQTRQHPVRVLTGNIVRHRQLKVIPNIEVGACALQQVTKIKVRGRIVNRMRPRIEGERLQSV